MSDTRSGGGIGQRDMYHILAPKCHGQDSAPLGEDHPLAPAATDAPALVDALATIFARVERVQKEVDLAGAGSGLDLVGTGDQIAGARLHAQPVQRRLPQRLLDTRAKVAWNLDGVRLERALE